ncbi:sulfatase-like hydrolase/transferase [Crateriforma conspicua]|uniref:Arylsulfatase n=1 Tax=Crateriforma conspicua TaxID=2527996 RepID=A0A5C6FUT7_9PLAN|nr:sulfatase-like hydrolase/transferase [Crateriforma conspicua]TWU66054.1 Arylsulfatase [Crateriforma conspicua]
MFSCRRLADRRVIGLVGIWIMGLAFAVDVCGDDSRRTNVVLVMADDMGWAQTGYYQHPILKTPHLDEMSRHSIRFDRFYAGAPVCSPTRASVLTGRNNDRTGTLSHGYPLRHQEVTIAQLLKKSGYTTGHFGKWHLNGLRGPGVPVLHTDSHHPGHFGFDQWISVTNFFDRDPIMSHRGSFVEYEGDSSEIVVDQALEFISRQAKSDQPFLAVIWYGTPHSPFNAAEADMEGFEDLDEASRNHYGELVAMDRSIGTLRQGLRDAGIADETILWFCSDNGGLPKIKPSSTGPLRGNKGTIYEGGLLVPALLEWPDRVDQPQTLMTRSGTFDILPTILDALGMKDSQPDRPIDGISLMPMIDAAVAGEPIPPRTKPLNFRHSGRLAVIDGDLKLLTTDIRKGNFELYDLANDLSETNDLFDSRPDDAKRLMEKLIQWNQSVQDSIEGIEYPEGRLLPGDPPSRFWNETPEYQPYIEQWRQRPEYGDWLAKRRSSKRASK